MPRPAPHVKPNLICRRNPRFSGGFSSRSGRPHIAPKSFPGRHGRWRRGTKIGRSGGGTVSVPTKNALSAAHGIATCQAAYRRPSYRTTLRRGVARPRGQIHQSPGAYVRRAGGRPNPHPGLLRGEDVLRTAAAMRALGARGRKGGERLAGRRARHRRARRAGRRARHGQFRHRRPVARRHPRQPRILLGDDRRRLVAQPAHAARDRPLAMSGAPFTARAGDRLPLAHRRAPATRCR